MQATATRVKGIDATYYTVRDLERCTEFYTKVFETDPSVKADFFTEWTFDDESSFGLYKSDQQKSGNSGSAMFRVDDVHQAAERLRTLDALVEHGDEVVGDYPTCYMAFGKDPEGNQFILHKRKG